MAATPPALPPSVEEAYKKKCIELKRRMNEVEENNDVYRLRKVRLSRGIRKMRLERAILLDTLAKRMRKNPAAQGRHGVGSYAYDESEGSSEGPPTVGCHPSPTIHLCPTLPANPTLLEPQPQEKPLRPKRGHRRPNASPPPALAPVPPSLAHQQTSTSTSLAPASQHAYTNGTSHAAHIGTSARELFAHEFLTHELPINPVSHPDVPRDEEGRLAYARDVWEGLPEGVRDGWERRAEAMREGPWTRDEEGRGRTVKMEDVGDGEADGDSGSGQGQGGFTAING